MLYIERISGETSEEQVVDGVCKINMEKDMWGTQGYIVKNKNIHRMLENTWTIDMPIDWKYITAIKSNKLIAYTFCPFLSKSDNHESTIMV
jgi:GR25 family glycosyltransferase involved in LPS biosynthesis